MMSNNGELCKTAYFRVKSYIFHHYKGMNDSITVVSVYEVSMSCDAIKTYICINKTIHLFLTMSQKSLLHSDQFQV